MSEPETTEEKAARLEQELENAYGVALTIANRLGLHVYIDPAGGRSDLVANVLLSLEAMLK